MILPIAQSFHYISLFCINIRQRSRNVCQGRLTGDRGAEFQLAPLATMTSAGRKHAVGQQIALLQYGHHGVRLLFDSTTLIA
jgi:hypothetical protein